MISKIFIDRPIFASVISIIIVILGLLAIKVLPVKEYPTLTPPQIRVQAVYPGADAETIAKTVAAPLEEAINGVKNMIYMSTTTSSNGDMTINVYFKVGTDPEIAKIDVNNRVQTALSKLPEEVRRLGIIVRERSPDLLKVYTFISKNNKRSTIALSNYILVNVLDDLKRIPGVGDAIIFGAKRYSIRVWLKPDKLAMYGLTPLDVYRAIKSQNEQFAAGTIGKEPIKIKKVYTYKVLTRGRFKTAKQFENIIIRANPDGSTLRLKDVARVELASESYNMESYYNGKPMVPVGIFLSPGANALEVGKKADEVMKKISKKFPPDIKYYEPYNPTLFVKESIKEVLYTLLIAICLVVLLIYFFLGNLRATIIPVLAIPVSIIGTFAGLYIFGFSINLLTLFGLILAIGLVVDDAIVVIENVERVLKESKEQNVKEAVKKAMKEITAPVIAIVFVLAAVFIPASFMGGFNGKMYQQFAITIAISIILSGIVALTLTPALCGVFLKKGKIKPIFFVRWFNALFEIIREIFTKIADFFIKFYPIFIVIFLIFIYFTYFYLKKIPTALVPPEDKGSLYVFTFLMPGSSLKMTESVIKKVDKTLLKNKYVLKEASLVGLDIESFVFKTDTAITFVMLKDWSERKTKNSSSMAIARQLMRKFYTFKDALIYVINPPPIKGMSTTGGFEFYLQDRKGSNIEKLAYYAKKLIYALNKSPEIIMARTNFTANVPQYFIKVDREKAKALNINIADIFNTIAMTFGKAYVNDFNLFGRVFHVNMESDWNFRDNPDDYRYIFVRSKNGNLIPVSSLITIKKITGPDTVQRFNMFNAIRITGIPAPGYTTGQAMNTVKKIAAEILPAGYTVSWSGTSYQEAKLHKSAYLPFLFAILFVFLILAALYESWSLPIAIILSVPFAVGGAILGLIVMHLENDIYFQVGIITLIGLSAKNAILMIEFAEERVKKGKKVKEAIIEAFKIRFRPIIMTSFAFIAGTLPLILSKGAGANSRHIIGTTVVFGMLMATLIGIFFIPVFYRLIRRKN